ncbi:MAG: N-6 DNA methylase, partial [Pseudomonadota bacterium]|nr:N-6 DNA methylase [Pseudomonadota bacterium]
HRHACAVSTDLREGAKQSIEILVNEFIHQKREARQKYLNENAQLYARELTHDALYYVYRLIFLLYLEARPDESVLLPLKSPTYKQGYSIDKLLETVFYDMQEGDIDYNGYFLSESLNRIFALVYHGLTPKSYDQTGFVVHRLKSELFDPEKIRHLDTIKLRNGKLQKILQALTLSKPKNKKEKRGRVSYATLGINQLGAAYEGLLSYTGFFAQRDLYRTKPAKVKQKDVAKEEENTFYAKDKIIEKYSSTEVDKKYRLTEDNFVLDEEGEQLINKRGSFVYRLAGKDRQLSASYYTPEELTQCVVKYALNALYEDKQHVDDLWQVKILEPAMGSGAFLIEAVNQLAEKIFKLEKPDNGMPADQKRKRLFEIKHQLIANNVYGVDLNPTAVELARFSLWLNCINSGMPPPQLTNLKVGNSLTGGWLTKNKDGIYNWLLIDKSWGKYGKQLETYDAEAHKELKQFGSKLYRSKLSNNDKRLGQVQAQATAMLQAFKQDYQTGHAQLTKCLNLWCSAFFINHNALGFFPATHHDYLSCIQKILHNKTLDEQLENFIDETTQHQKFFHWQLEFPQTMFNGGFDLILGNPPWVKAQWEDVTQISDYHAIPAVKALNAAATRVFAKQELDTDTKQVLAQEYINIEGYSKLLESDFYQLLKGVANNSYKSFTALALHLLSLTGVTGYLHPDGLLEDDKATEIRGKLYEKMRYHFQFQNEMRLFDEIHHCTTFSINILQNKSNHINFQHIGNLFTPSTITACHQDREQKTAQAVPMIKDEQGKLDTRGHRERIISITEREIELFGKFLNTDSSAPPFLNLHSQGLFKFIKKIAAAHMTVGEWLKGEQNYCGSSMFHETGDQDKGNIIADNRDPAGIEQLVLSGPHINTGCPLAQETMTNYKSSSSYEALNLNTISDDFIPRARYQLATTPAQIDATMPKLQGQPHRSFYRLATRMYVNPSNERCMFTCMLPREASHIYTIVSFAVIDLNKLLVIGGISASLIIDALQRLTNSIHFLETDFAKLPLGDTCYFASIARRFMSLNGLTIYYDELWQATGRLKKKDSLLCGRKLYGYGEDYQRNAALRNPDERKQALLEIDVLTALSFGLSIEELRQVYEILFPVLAKYDRQNGFDRKGKMHEAYVFFQQRGW